MEAGDTGVPWTIWKKDEYGYVDKCSNLTDSPAGYIRAVGDDNECLPTTGWAIDSNNSDISYTYDWTGKYRHRFMCANIFNVNIYRNVQWVKRLIIFKHFMKNSLKS